MKLLVILFIALSVMSTAAEAGRGGGSSSSGGRSSSLSSSRSSSSSSRSSSSSGYNRSGAGTSRSWYSAGSTSRNSASSLRSRSTGSSLGGLSARTTRTATGTFRVSDSGAQVRVSVPQATASRMFAARVTGSSAAGFRSLSYGVGQGASAAKPSERLQTIIREREVSNGPGWFGTAALVWLLSQHDLSDSDRSWISSQLSSSNDGDGQDASVDRITKALTFTWDGLPEAVKVGQPVKIVVSAVDAKGHHQALDCTITNGSASTTLTENGVVMTWTPATAGMGFLQCDGLSEGERRAVAVTL